MAQATLRGRPFRRGVSGNPGGRPRVAGEIRDLARRFTATALAALVEICENGRNEVARVAAASALLDRAWGKPGLPIEQSVAEAPQVAVNVRFVNASAPPLIEGAARRALPAPPSGDDRDQHRA